MDELQLPCEPTSPRAARRWLRALVEHHDADAGDTLELLLTEVVTNVVVHAGTPSTLRFFDVGPVLCVEVEDGSVQPPYRARPSRASDENGRGVELLNSLSVFWGCRRVPGGKVVWFCVPTTPAAVSSGTAQALRWAG
ncbi:ATP-binding protein [Aquipuribacter hungaricus]|uniref:ATP-binding protein n=1 Tax=Aquipuribacter hungaricus TaxID=545624 RepID=A0ABV7WLX3_9MICO